MLVGLGWGLDATSDYSSIINNAAATYNLDPTLLTNLINAESSGDPNAIGPNTKYGNAQGLTQLIPSTAAMLGVTDPFDPTQSINAGAKYLASLVKQFGDVPTALAAYNWGPGNVATYTTDSWPTETVNYVNKILGTSSTTGVNPTLPISSSDSSSTDNWDFSTLFNSSSSDSLVSGDSNNSSIGIPLFVILGIGLLAWKVL